MHEEAAHSPDSAKNPAESPISGHPDTGGIPETGDSGNPPASPAAPEPFTLAAPQGYPVTPAELERLNALCVTAGLTREQGEAVLEHMAGNYAAFREQRQAQGRAWIEEFRADREFGGDRFDASVAEARKALAMFDANGAVRALLAETGYGDNPDVLRIFARVGRALGEDKLPGAGGGAADRPLEDRFYPHM